MRLVVGVGESVPMLTNSLVEKLVGDSEAKLVEVEANPVMEFVAVPIYCVNVYEAKVKLCLGLRQAPSQTDIHRMHVHMHAHTHTHTFTQTYMHTRTHVHM